MNPGIAESAPAADLSPPVLGPWRIEPQLNRAIRGTEEVRVEPRVMQALSALLRCNGAPLTRDALIQQVWGHPHVTEDALNRTISKVRKLLDELDCGATIETLPKVGYRLRPGPLPCPLPQGEGD